MKVYSRRIKNYMESDPKGDTTFLPYIFGDLYTHRCVHAHFFFSHIWDHIYCLEHFNHWVEIHLASVYQKMEIHLKHIYIPRGRPTLITTVFAFNKKQNVLSCKLFSGIWNNPFKIEEAHSQWQVKCLLPPGYPCFIHYSLCDVVQAKCGNWRRINRKSKLLIYMQLW